MARTFLGQLSTFSDFPVLNQQPSPLDFHIGNVAVRKGDTVMHIKDLSTARSQKTTPDPSLNVPNMLDGPSINGYQLERYRLTTMPDGTPVYDFNGDKVADKFFLYGENAFAVLGKPTRA